MTAADLARQYSHPDQPVRHSYPLALREEGFGPACKLCLQTMPYILLRLSVLIGYTIITVIWLVLCGGIAALFTHKDGSGGGIVLFLLGFGLPLGVFAWARKYVLYLVKAGHIAVLTKLITDGALPEGVNQVQYGKQIVADKFAQTNVMFVLDSLVKGVARSFNRTLDWVADLLPIPGLDSVMQIVNKIIDNATNYIDETILSYNLARNDENVWRSSLDGLVYYAQNVKAVRKTAVISLVLEYALVFCLFLLCLIPAWLIGRILPHTVADYAWIFALILAGCIRSAVLHPLFLTMVALTFHKHVYQQPINAELASTLSAASSKFDELKEKAKGWSAEQMSANAVPQTSTPS